MGKADMAASLTPFQRMLTGTDGTVTHLLEAYAGEPIEVKKLQQVFDTPSEEDDHLRLSGDEMVLRRHVVLRTRHTHRNLLYAYTVVVLDRVGAAFIDALVDTEKPIGLVLVEHRLETLCEVLEVGRRSVGTCAVHFGVDPEDSLIVRTYRILARRRPVMLSTEMFPAHSLRSLPT